MVVEVSRLSNGLTVATETIPNFEIRRLGRLGQVGRPQRIATTSTASPIFSSTWRSRARRGARACEIA